MNDIISAYGDLLHDYNYSSSRYLNVNNASYAIVRDKDCRFSRPEGRMDYQFIYVHEGKMRFLKDGERCEAGSGDIVFFKPHECQEFTFLHRDRRESEFYWINFSGRNVDEILSDALFFGGQVENIGKNDDAKQCFRDIINVLTLRESGYLNTCNYHFLKLLYIIRKALDLRTSHVKKNQAMSSVLLEMHNNNKAPTDLDHYASLCGLSRYAFAHAFTKVMGCSPIAYLLSVKFAKAREMLKNSDFTIGEIASSLGFSSLGYFCKQFKKHEGVTPTEFREGQQAFTPPRLTAYR